MGFEEIDPAARWTFVCAQYGLNKEPPRDGMALHWWAAWLVRAASYSGATEQPEAAEKAFAAVVRCHVLTALYCDVPLADWEAAVALCRQVEGVPAAAWVAELETFFLADKMEEFAKHSTTSWTKSPVLRRKKIREAVEEFGVRYPLAPVWFGKSDKESLDKLADFLIERGDRWLHHLVRMAAT